MAEAVPERSRWAVDLLDPRGADRILEVGCGAGVTAGLTCDRLTTGQLLAVDRSPVAIDRTTRRNAGHVDAGRLAVRQVGIGALELEPACFDAVLAVDVNLFWTRDPGPELLLLRRALRRGGRLLLLWGAHGPTGPERVLPASSITCAVGTSPR